MKNMTRMMMILVTAAMILGTNVSEASAACRHVKVGNRCIRCHRVV